MSTTHEQLNDLRRRVLEGATYTPEELAQAIRALVADRLAMAQPKEPKAKSKQSQVNLDDLL